MFWLVFLVPHLNLTSNYHLEVHRHHLSQFSLSEALLDILSDLLPPSRPGATCLYLVCNEGGTQGTQPLGYFL